MAPLYALLEVVHSTSGKRTKRAASRIKLSDVRRNNEHTQAFVNVKQALANAATSNPSKVRCLFSDASLDHWGAILTQLPPKDVDIPFHEQRHEPLAFLSGSFKGSSHRWTTPEKEAYAIIAAVERLDYALLVPGGFRLFTDHKKLTFIFNSTITNPGMACHTVYKIKEWCQALSAFDYTIVHVPGDLNVWSDLLSRWGADKKPAHSVVTKMNKLGALFRAPICPDLDAEFTWPSKRDICTSQQRCIRQGNEVPPPDKKSKLHVNSSGSVWIPAEDVTLQLRICIVGHCGRGGHRGAATTTAAMRQHFYWTGMNEDIENFCHTCLHCQVTTGGNRMPRPISHSLHASKPNELIHFDFSYTGPSGTGEVYVLIIKDDASDFRLAGADA